MRGSLRYLPGSAVAVVSGRTAVLLDLDPHDPLVNRIAGLLQDGAGIDDVLDALVSTGLKSLADFGAFHVSDAGVRIVVRGQVGGSVGRNTGLHAEHTMWFDSWQPGETTAALEISAASPTESLAIGEGVVLASAVLCGEPVPLAAAAPPKPESVAEPVKASIVEPSAPSVSTPVLAVAEPAVAAPEADAANNSVSNPSSAADADPAADSAAANAESVAAVIEDSIEVDPGATMDAPLTISGEQLLAASASKEAEAATPSLITGMPWAVEEPAPAAADEPAVPPHPVSQPAGPFAASPSLEPAAAAESAPVANPAPVAEPASVAEPTPRAESAPPAASAPQTPAPQPVTTPTPVVSHPALAGLVRPQPSPAADVSADRTINRASLVGLPSVVMVVAARCSEGHLSPAYAGSCRVCRGNIPQQHPIEIPRPTLGQLRLSTGGVVSLDRPAILGRNPRVPAGYVGEQPNLVRLSDPDKDVSGQHLEVSLDYWNVLVCDLGSTNGTEVILPGEMPVVLRPNDPVIIEPGTRVVLAGSISFLFEVLP